MSDFPLALYRAGSEFVWDGKPTDMLAVDDEDARDDALASGWALGADYLAPAPLDVNYDVSFLDQNAVDIKADLPALTDQELAEYLEAEAAGKARKGVIDAITAEIDSRKGA